MKFKLKSGSGNVGRILSIEADKDDELAYVDAERVYRGDLDSFLPFTYDRGPKAYEFSYFLGQCVSLDKVLAAPVAPDVLRSTLGSLLHMMQVCEANGLSRLRVVLDSEYVYYDPALGMLRFAYVPVRSYVSETGEAGLISRICSAAMADASDQQFAVSVWDFVHRTTILTSVAFEGFLEGWGLQASGSGRRLSRKAHSALGADTRTEHGWDFVTDLREEEARRRFDEAATNRQRNDEANPRDEGRVVLVRVATGEAYALAFGRNVLGRAADCTVPLADSGSVSRKHAEIDVHEDSIILRDLNSTNGTFVDGRRLEPGCGTGLQAGARFVLGEEEFQVK